jgi:hypothetical protein
MVGILAVWHRVMRHSCRPQQRIQRVRVARERK